MRDANHIAAEYIAFWNASDPEERRRLFEAGWASVTWIR